MLRAALLLAAVSPLTMSAQTLEAAVATAPLPIAAVVNSVTNKIYVANFIANGQVTVIDGATNATTAIAVGSYPWGIDVNMVTNKVYVANTGSNTMTVIDGATNATTTIPVGVNPSRVAVNPTTNRIYVVNCSLYGTISVIDGATNTVTKNIFAGLEPAPALAVDPVKNVIFAVAGDNNLFTVGNPTVYLIDEKTGEMDEAVLGTQPQFVALDPVIGQLYVLVEGGIHAVYYATAHDNELVDHNLASLNGARAVAVNTATGKAYLASGNNVIAIDGKTLASSAIPILGPTAPTPGIAVDQTANTIYVTSMAAEGQLTAIDGVTNQTTAIAVGANPSVVVVNPVTHKVYVLNNDAKGTVSVIDGIGVSSTPALTLQPQSQTLNTGSTVVFNAAASGRPNPTYQWAFNGIPLQDGKGISGSTDSNLVLSGVTAANAGAYTCAATNSLGSATSASANLGVISTSNPGRITNLSTRAYIISDDLGSEGSHVLIAGFVIGGTGSKPLVIRGVGPALANFGLTGVVESPSLALYDSANPANLMTQDTGWQTAPLPPTLAPWRGAVAPIDATAADFAQVGAFALPIGSADSAVKVSLPAGAYSAQISATDNSAGVVLAELYDEDPGSPDAQLINISSRARVASGGDAIIAGFQISGSSAETVLIRASGPALGALGVSETTPYPQLQLYDGRGNLIAANVSWGGDPEISAVASRVGAFAWTDPQSTDSALLITLPPGNFTAEVTIAGAYYGNALIEVYAVP